MLQSNLPFSKIIFKNSEIDYKAEFLDSIITSSRQSRFQAPEIYTSNLYFLEGIQKFAN